MLYLAKLLLLAPASNASSERVFSKLRLVKNYLRSTMNQDRLESLMALSVHKKELDSVDLIRVSNNFVRRKPKLRAIDFSEFSNADLICNNHVCDYCKIFITYFMLLSN